MLYSAGKITLTTVFTAVCVFAFVFLLDVGKERFNTVLAQATTSSAGTATTTLTVLNIPPEWVVLAYEFEESSTNTPTNSGDQVEWRGVADNDSPYFLLVCSTDADPIANAADDFDSLGTAPPECDSSAIQWAVSGPTEPLEEAVAATTTTEEFPFAESNDWYAWVCDDDPINPRCRDEFSQGLNATNSSPFVVNSRPLLTAVTNDGPTLPGDVITFTSSSTDPDTLRGDDEIILYLCDTDDFDTEAVACAGTTYASTTGVVTEDASAAFEIRVPQMSGLYAAYAFLVDEFDHLALNSIQSDFEVANATPVVNQSSISLTGSDGDSLLVLTQPGGETEGFQLTFEVSDNNSCVAFDEFGDVGAPGSEFDDVIISVFRSGIGSTTCDGTAGPYDPNNCYTSGVGQSVWNYTCTASTTTCGATQDPEDDLTMLYECEFPLWYVAEPTQGSSISETPFFADEWAAAAAVIDKDQATSTFTQGTFTVDLAASLFFNLATAEIPYGQLEPGDSDDFLQATTTIVALGNVGVDQDLLGTSMCSQFSPGNCPVSATSTIPAEEQEFATSTIAYGTGFQLSDVTEQFLALNILKPTSTSTPTDGSVFWGIGVPETITLAGDYTGINTFTALVSDGSTW